jgi:hypothetical protein
MRKTATAAVLSACVTSSLVAVAMPAAQAATRQACVNKKSGELRILLKSSKKCKKGWKKIAFDQTGAVGPAGPAGPAGPVHVKNVKDATGAVVGQSLDVWDSLNGSVLMPFDGGLYWYTLGTGKVESTWDAVYYTDAACSATAAVTSVGSTTMYVEGLSPASRVVSRPSSSVAPRAFLPTSTVRAVLPGEQFWYLDGAGACTATWPWYSNVAALTPVSTPPDYTGPLSIS